MVRVKHDAHYQYYKAVNKAKHEIHDIQTDLLGNYQQHNIKTVLTAVEYLAGQGFDLFIHSAIRALQNVKRATGLRGRWEWLQENPTVICDVAHNPAGIMEVTDQFNALNATAKHIVIGFVKDKDIQEALSLLPKDATYYFCNAQIERALPAADLKIEATKAGLKGNDYPTVTAAVSAAKAAMSTTDVLLITGSFFIVGEALELWQHETSVI